EALKAFAIAPLADLPGRMLSAGQKRRLALARLLVAPAQVWLLDEPTVGLDRESLGRLNQAIAAHRARGGRVVVATHAPIDMDGAQVLGLDRFMPLASNASSAFDMEERW
ncbi:MAG: ATP-binding cassette domain-containing protein, partial [Kiloniellaceae bacterium]